ncbi:MAG: FAD-dependent oxidoreductase, partial [Chitinophagales bacterium]
MKIVVVGNGMVGYKFCEKLAAKNNPSQFSITVFGEEVRPAYDRVHLSEFFAGKSGHDLSLASSDWYGHNNIALHLGDPVQLIDRSRKKVRSFHGIEAPYDILILATGSSAFVPSIPGV